MMYVNQIIMLHTLHLYSNLYHLYLNETGRKNRRKILNKRIPLLAHKIIEYKNIECWHGCWKHSYTAQGKRIGTISLESNLTVYIKIFLPLKANSFTYVFYPKGNNVNKGLSIYELFNKWYWDSYQFIKK